MEMTLKQFSTFTRTLAVGMRVVAHRTAVAAAKKHAEHLQRTVPGCRVLVRETPTGAVVEADLPPVDVQKATAIVQRQSGISRAEARRIILRALARRRAALRGAGNEAPKTLNEAAAETLRLVLALATLASF